MKLELCPCGRPAVRRAFGTVPTCQRCLDLDKIVHELHRDEHYESDNLMEDTIRERQERRKRLDRERYYRLKQAGKWIHWREYEKRKQHETQSK